MIEICPKCLYRPTDEEHAYSPDSCPKCGCLYSAREQINKKKRRENEKLNAWRITRWSAKNKKKKASFLWTLSLIAIIVFIILIFNISNIKENKNIEHANVIQNKNTKENSSQIIHKNEVKKSFSEKLKYDEKGMLTITSKKEVSILFVQKGSNKQFGPFHIKKGRSEKINLERGDYIAYIDDGKKKNITSISFIGKTGQLNL
ncbi:hypothetical protein [Desulfomicrobium orale]|uniref:hypothetical protein n=1 Tax=Desulfomicrobium orale TaxID=132132 RepID=UPI001243BBFC|nr:hypothetical protein [Desulfomicrobium orale]